MSGVVLIRLASATDYEFVSALWKGVDDLHRESLPHMFREPNETWPDRADIEALIAGPDSAILVAEEEGAVAGFITLLVRRQNETQIRPARTYVEIDNMAVDSTKQRRGIGGRLMRAAADWAARQGVQRLELNVYAFNAAAGRLYQSAGFATVFRRLSCEI